MSRPQSPVYSPVRLPDAKRRTSSPDERSSQASCSSSYSASTSSSSIPSPNDDDRRPEQCDPFGLEFASVERAGELGEGEYFPSSHPVRASSLALPAGGLKVRTAHHLAGHDTDDADSADEHAIPADWERAQDTPRQERGPAVTTPAAST